MDRIQKIKAYFTKYDFYTWKDFDWNNYDLRSKTPNESFLLDIGLYVRDNLTSSEAIGNKRHRLKAEVAIACNSLDDLIPLIDEIIRQDYKQTSVDSVKHNWDFQYFVTEHNKCENTICIFNGLREKEKPSRNCVYPIISIRKHQNKYYCWNHLT